GIENSDHSDGLLYTYWNLYPAGAASLSNGRAIAFVPVYQGPSGTVTGTVTNDYNGAPIAAATITLLEDGRSWTTNENGSYGGSAPVGVYTLVADHAGFAPDTAWNVEVLEGEDVAVDFSLTDDTGPLLETYEHPSTNDTEGPYPISVTIEEYSGLDAARLYYKAGGADFTPLTLEPQGGGAFLAEIPGQPYTTHVAYYTYARDGLGQESYDPSGAPGELYSFFVAPTTSYYMDNMEADQGWTVGAPGDDATTGIWERVDPNATYDGGTMIQPEDDHTPDPGTRCFITGQSAPGAGQGDNDVDDGTTTLISPVFDLSVVAGIVQVRYYRWYTNNTGSTTNDSWVVRVTDDGSTWVDLENTMETDRSWRLMEFNLADFVELTDQVQFRFLASDLGDGGIVEAGVDDFELLLTGVSGAPEVDRGEAVFALYPNRPNPASRATTIRYALERAGPVRLRIVDVQGRVLRYLVDGRQKAGSRSAVWDRRDAAGRPVPSGIYFYELLAGPHRATRKLTVIR
ncbi:MAG: T9SS type A sorting domain-containing protein, partial [Candidatus Eisenbacteria bacterium]|nr:T9SS type A sorting domain-containing protein [Candidatus Eisenbacteria bacterium]